MADHLKVLSGVLFSVGIVYSGLEGVDWRISAPSAQSALSYVESLLLS